MLTIEELMSIEKSELQEASKAIDRNELPRLVELLAEKDDKIRYQALLLLQGRSSFSNTKINENFNIELIIHVPGFCSYMVHL